jgi:hypothetical protein
MVMGSMEKRVKASFEFHGGLPWIGGTVRVEVNGDNCSEAIESLVDCISRIPQIPLLRLARILNSIINTRETLSQLLRRL